MDVGTTAVPPTSFPVAKEESRESVDTRDTEEERIRLEIAELPDLKNRVLMRRFCDAAYAGDMFQLKRIAEELPEEVCRGRDPDDKHGWTVLHYAAWKGHVDVLDYAINDLHMYPDSLTRTYRTPLHIASNSGKIDIVKRLVKKFGADVNARDKSGWAPLHIAAFRLHKPVVEYLIEVGKANASVNCSVGSVADLASADPEILKIVQKAVRGFDTPYSTTSMTQPQAAAKTPAKPAAKPAAKSAAKPAAKPAVKPVAKTPAKPTASDTN